MAQKHARLAKLLESFCELLDSCVHRTADAVRCCICLTFALVGIRSFCNPACRSWDANNSGTSYSGTEYLAALEIRWPHLNNSHTVPLTLWLTLPAVTISFRLAAGLCVALAEWSCSVARRSFRTLAWETQTLFAHLGCGPGLGRSFGASVAWELKPAGFR